MGAKRCADILLGRAASGCKPVGERASSGSARLGYRLSAANNIAGDYQESFRRRIDGGAEQQVPRRRASRLGYWQLRQRKAAPGTSNGQTRVATGDVNGDGKAPRGHQ